MMRAQWLAGLACASAALHAQPAPITIGGVSSRPGERVSITVPVARGVDSGTTIPISVLQGRRPGPTLALIAGTHGMEVAPVVALQRVRSLVDPAQMAGTLILVHVANMPSFMHRTVYRSPWDQKNLNRVYPGATDGTVSQRIAHAITTQVIDRSDYLIDMHAGDGNEALRPYAYWSRLRLDARVDSLSGEMARAWGADHVVIQDERPTDLRATLYTQNTAQVRGKPSITTETGFLGLPEESMVQRNVDGALRVMRWLGMLPGAAERQAQVTYLDESVVLTSPGTGTWHAAVQMRETVAKDQLIGRLTNFFGETIAEVRAPWAGEVLYVIGNPAMAQGEPVAMLGRSTGASR
jgi:predicted deacylase